MNELGLLRILAEIPAWGTGLGFVAAVIGGILVSRRLSVREEFADSYVTMGVLGFGGLIAVGSLVPGLFFDLENGTRFLLGLGVVLIGLGIWMFSREMLPGRLVAVLCLLTFHAGEGEFAVALALCARRSPLPRRHCPVTES